MARLIPILLLSATLAAAADVSPPDGARLVGSNTNVTLRWDSNSKDAYIQVLAANAVFFEGPVKGNSLTLQLKPDVFYRWKVNPGTRSGVFASGETYSFQHTSHLELRYDGPAGQLKENRRNSPTQNYMAASGGDGGPGGSVTVDLDPAGDFVEVSVKGPRQNAKFLFIPGSHPIGITANGGIGADGEPGAPGLQAVVAPDGFPMQPTDGLPGGNGGNGGDGGTINVRSRIPNPKEVIAPEALGGFPGRGGPGGMPGNTLVAGPFYNARPGQPGRDGRPGKPGRVVGL